MLINFQNNQIISQRPVRTEQKVIKKRFRKTIYLIAIFILIYLFATGNHGIYHLWKLKKEKQKLIEINSMLKDEKITLREGKSLLETDKPTIEKMAREKYGMAKKKEKIYKIILGKPQNP